MDWQEHELVALTRAYCSMLQHERAAEPYIKVEWNRRVQEETGRSKGSVEFKFCNLTAVLADLGVTGIRGYLPRANYQLAMVPVAERIMSVEFPELLDTAALASDLAPSNGAQSTEAMGRAVVGTYGASNESAQERISGLMARATGDPYLVLHQIWGKATGGSEVAVDPSDEVDPRFHVDPAPGVKEACSELRTRAETGGPLQMVFLVGGPGGGKSHALIELTRGLAALASSDDGLARRSYSYSIGEQTLRVVNDASIPATGTTTSHPLSDDIERAVANREYLLACVNRGILVEEANALTDNDCGAAVIRWLAGIDQAPHDQPITVNEADKGQVLVHATVATSGGPVDLVMVHVDMCSLLEPRPRPGEDGRISPYKVLRLNQRAAKDLLDIPAGALLGKVVSEMVPEAAMNPHDPVLANVKSLSSDAGQRGLLTVLRSTEAVAGARLGFREVWGAVVRALAGDGPREGDPEALRLRFPVVDPSEPHAVFEELRSRAGYRFNQAIFGVGVTSERRSADPLLRITSLVDPVLDAVPGRLQDNIGVGWASPVLDAFSGLITSVSPLETLLQSLAADDGLHDVVTSFDRALDAAFLSATGPGEMDVPRRREVVSWYGDYLCRLYAISNGVAAFRAEVETWLRTRTTLPTDFSDALRTLLRPWSDPENPLSDYLLPLFSSRTVPVTGATPENRLVMKGEGSVTLNCITTGDLTTVTMLEDGTSVGEIELDFALIRSAMSCSERRLGMTEQSAVVGPRVERFRAKRLTSPKVAHSSLRLLGPAGAADVVMED